MGLSFEEAVAKLTGEGGPYELVESDLHGQRLRVFKNTPPSLRTLFDSARKRGDETFLVYEDERWSFAETLRHVDAAASMLVEHYGVKPGDRVAIAMRNYPEWIVSFAAITSVGAISVSMNAWWTEDEMSYGLEDSGATLLIADRERILRAKSALERLGVRSVCVRSEDGELLEGVDRWESVLQLGVAMPEVEIDPHSDATILYTSGTTGFPKGAVSTHHAVLSSLLSFAVRALSRKLMYPQEADDESDPTSFILVVPLFHVTGCVAVMLSAFAAGNKIVMMYKWNPERALELIERERITMFVGVPTQSWDLLESPDFASRDTSSLTNVGGGGAPAPPELVKRVDKSFSKGRPGIGYGMTETNAYGPQNSGDDYVRKPTSTGRCVPSMELRITDPEGNVLPKGEIGEIWFRGPMLIRGYWNKPEATAETIVAGWLRSGDLGCLDDEGFVYVSDRAKDMVIRAGENVYCAEVEAAIYEHSSVYEAAVFGVPHERLGEEVAVAVFTRPGAELDAESLRAHVAERLAPFKVPSHVEFHTEQLPRNASGKILKRELRDDLAARLGRTG
jgi:long-chain acyl-CoA synthetase